ncbi:MAG: hypothetical protein FWC41_06525 [Firmicutes bacterium]|nr:hypothetical protein [Bacillota bacterium]
MQEEIIIAPDNQHTEINIIAIVKNDISIKRMIDTFSIVANRFFILDTGSTDETLTVIQDLVFNDKMPIVLFERPFENFVYSKNFILNKAHIYLKNHIDKKQIIIFVNADEFLNNDVYMWKDELKNIQHNQVFNINIKDTINETITSENRIWVYNPSKPLFFNGPFVYEYLDTVDYQIIDSDLEIYHRKNSNEDVNVKLDLHIELLNKYIEWNNNQDPNWMRAMFYLGQTYKDKGDSNKAIELWETYLMNYNHQYNNSSERFIVAYNIAQEYYSKGFIQFAMNWVIKSISEYQDTTCFRREPYLILYSIHFSQYWNSKDELQKIVNNIDVVINTESNPQTTTMYVNPQINFYLEELKKQVIERIEQIS